MSEQPPFATTLVLGAAEEPNDRAARLCASLKSPPDRWWLKDLDATGELGNSWVLKMESVARLEVSDPDFKALLSEPGQVIELDAVGLSKMGETVLRILVRDGCSLDWLGFGNPEEAGEPGPFRLMDCAHFYWPR